LKRKSCNHIKGKRSIIRNKLGDSQLMNKKLIQAVVSLLAGFMFLSTFQFPIIGAAENEWTSMAPMPTSRGGLGVAVVNGKIYAIGGVDDDGQLAVNEEYDPDKNTWRERAPMPTARSGFAVAVYQSKIYVIGGTVGSGVNIGFTGATEVYDPATNTWETKVSMPTPRADLCASVANGKIYLIGGKDYWGDGPLYHDLNITEVYNPVSNSWTSETPMPVPAFGYASAVADDEIYVFGGARQLLDGFTNLTSGSSTQVYDTLNQTWSNKAGLPTNRSYAAAETTSGLTAPMKVYVVGGFDQSSYINLVHVYDSELDAWNAGALLPTARGYLGLAVVDDILYAIGGFDGEKWLDVNECYLPFGYGTVPPKVRILSPENKTYASDSVELVLSVNRPTNWIGYSLDSQTTITVSGDVILTGLAEGEHTVKVYVNDTFGNLASSNTILFSVDTLPPRIVVLFPENKTYGETDIQSTITIDEPVSWIGYSLNGEDNMTINGNITIAVLLEGSHNIIFFATDLVGNTGATEIVYFNIAPFPIVIVAAVAVTITIVVATTYLLLKRRKTIAKNKTKKDS
jgi:N-acetylneuraminic acid mutarotase